jgi:hypothetical protein
MRKILFSLSVILLLCFSVNAQEYDYCAGAGGVTACTDTTSTGLLIRQGFESCTAGEGAGTCTALANAQTATLDNNEVWTATVTTGGAINVAHATSPMRGSYQLHVDGGDSTYTSLTSPTFSPSGNTTYYHFVFKFGVAPASDRIIFAIRTSADAAIATIYLNPSAKLYIYQAGAADAVTTDALSANTAYHVWVSHTQGTGNNQTITLEFTAVGTASPTGSGNKYVISNTGTPTGAAGLIRYSSIVIDVYFDQGMVSNSAITNVCE